MLCLENSQRTKFYNNYFYKKNCTWKQFFQFKVTLQKLFSLANAILILIEVVKETMKGNW